MATRTTSTSMSIGTDAEFRALGVWISDSFGVFGWVNVFQSFATGTDWTSVTTPAANNTARVVEIWRMDDALQSTVPCFIRIEYGRSNTNLFGMRFQLGTGHDGSGALTNILMDTGVTYWGVTTANANNLLHHASGATNRFVFAMGLSGTSWTVNNSFHFGVERRLDVNGDPSGNGFIFARFLGQTPTHNASGASSTGPFGATSFFAQAIPSPFTSAAHQTYSGDSAVITPFYCAGPLEVGYNFTTTPRGMFAVGNEYEVTLFGNVVNYLTSNDVSSMFSTITSLGIRYE